MTREVPTDDNLLELLLHRDNDGGGSSFHVDRDRLLDAFEQLGPEQVLVLNALFWEGLSIREIARQRGWSRSRVVTLRRTALERLAVLLA